VRPLPRPTAGSRTERVLRGLDRVSERGMLWGAVTAVLLAGHGPGRRAGVRGALAAVATSTVVDGAAKPLLPRVHPEASRFPSAHAATAAAFTAGASLESRGVGAALVPAFLSVTGARVALGERRALEAGAGAVLGVGIALLTTRWWPAVGHHPARARPARHAPALGDGAGLVLVANVSAGTPGPLESLLPGESDGDDDRPSALAHIEAILPRAQVLVPEPGVDVVVEMEQALQRPAADGELPRAVGVAGGDGSVAAIAGVAQRHGLPLVVLPEGTLNHFARDVGITDTPSALRAARDGHAVLVDVGLVDTAAAGSPAAPMAFVNTASLGGYPDMVQLREQWEDRLGKWPSAALALMRVLAEATPLEVELDGSRRTVWILFVGNGAYRPTGMAPVFRPSLDARVLDVRYLRADLPFSRTRFVAAVLAGTLLRSRVYVARRLDRLDVQVLGDPVGLATDGEVQPDATRFAFRIAPRPVPVYRPQDEG